MAELTLDLGAAEGSGAIQIEARTESVSVPSNVSRHCVPFFIPRLQTYYWSREWQEGEREALEELRRGEARTFDDPDEALRWLNSPEDE